MKNFFEQYSLHDLNQEIHSMIHDNKVNHLKVFLAADKQSKLSVTLKPNIRARDRYHGLHPKFDEDMLRTFLGQLEDNSVTNFWDTVTKFQYQDTKLMDLVVMDKEDTEAYLSKVINNQPFKEELEVSLLGKAILHIASHFGYTLQCTKKHMYEEIKSTLRDGVSERGICWECCDHSQQIMLLGVWPHDFIETMSSKYDINLQDSNLVIQTSDYSTRENLLYHLLSFQGDWGQHFKLITSDIYYSGVMPCVKKIDYEINPSLSGRVKFLVFNAIRTTYATVDTMDNAQILKHPFFQREGSQKYYDQLIEFNYYEDTLQEKYLYNEKVDQKEDDQRNYEAKMIGELNKYLKNSLNTHTIAVSSNLITADGYLIAAKRGTLNIDAGEYYCSANGQTEFRDENVDFYRKSVFEDMPTMDYFSKYRVDLTKEIQRECIAELGVASFDLNWNYYGVSYLSINNKIEESDNNSIEKSKAIKSRRMHFNVLMSNSISQSFREVIKTHKVATESFENEVLVGIETRVFKGKMDFLKSMTLSLYYWLDENKSKIFLFLLFISILLGKQNYASMDVSDSFDLALITVYLFISFFSWIKDRELRKHMISKYYYLPRCFLKKELKMENVLNSLSKKTDNGKFHAIFRVMYVLHFLSLIEDDED